MNTTLKRIIFPLLILGLTIPSFGQGSPQKDGRKANKAKMVQKLDLTEEQQDQMKDLRYAHEKIMIDLRANMKNEQLDLRKLKTADEPNKKKIYAQIEKVGKARTAMEKAGVDHQLEVRKVLTDEQYKIFKKKMNRRDGHREGTRKGKGSCRMPFRQ